MPPPHPTNKTLLDNGCNYTTTACLTTVYATQPS